MVGHTTGRSLHFKQTQYYILARLTTSFNIARDVIYTVQRNILSSFRSFSNALEVVPGKRSSQLNELISSNQSMGFLCLLNAIKKENNYLNKLLKEIPLFKRALFLNIF